MTEQVEIEYKEILSIVERCSEQTNDVLILVEYLRTIIDALSKRVGALEQKVDMNL